MGFENPAVLSISLMITDASREDDARVRVIAGGRSKENARGRRMSECVCRGPRVLVREKGNRRESAEVQ